MTPDDSSFSEKLRAAANKELSLLSEPHQPNVRSTVYLLLDCSGSMSGDKLDSAKKGSLEFARDACLQGFLVGLIPFDTEPRSVLKAGHALPKIEQSLASVKASGSTNLETAIRLGISEMAGSRGMRLLFVVTDGVPNDANAALRARDEAVRVGIEIMALGTDDANKNFLDRLVTRKELSVKVERQQLQGGMSQMAKLLDHPRLLRKLLP
jgi:molecular chaperone DnaK